MFLLPSEKGSTLKGNNLLPFFPFRADSFSEGFQCAEKLTGSHTLVQNSEKNTRAQLFKTNDIVN